MFFTLPFSPTHILYLSRSLFYHHSSRYINTLLDTLGTTDFTEIRDAFPFAEFLLSVKFHRSRITESRQVYRMSRKKRRKISPSQFERLDLEFRARTNLSISDFSTDSPRASKCLLQQSITDRRHSFETSCNNGLFGGSARYLKILRFTIYWTPFFLLLIVIVEQSVHIKYTKSTQRQKRLVSSRKISYKIFALPSLFLLFFLFSFLLFKFSPSRKANLSLIFGTENAIVDPSLRRRERDARAITIYFIYFFIRLSHYNLRLAFPFLLFFFFKHCRYFMSLKKGTEPGTTRAFRTSDPAWRAHVKINVICVARSRI